MKILHTSDWHLGISLHGVSLLEDQREMVACLLESVRAEQVDAVVIAGDIFDHAVARPDAIDLYNDAMTALCRDCSLPVLLIPGNHDGAARLSACSALLQDAGLHIAGRLEQAFEPVVLGDAAFFLLPYFNIEQVRQLFPEETVRSYSDAMAVVVRQMRERFVPGRRQILVAHCFAAGSQLSESDRTALVGGSSQIACEAFDGFDYVALGHLHRAQEPGGSLRYSGSPWCYSFSEAGQGKSFTLLETETLVRRELPVHTSRMLRVCKGELASLQFACGFDPHREDYLKIELTDAPAGLETLEYFRERYPNLLLLTGVSPQPDTGAGSLTVEQLSELGPEELLQHFCVEVGGEPLTEEQLGWFREAAEQADKEAVQ